MRQGSVVIEPLEKRQLLAAVTITEAMTPAGSQLQIQGSGSNDRIVVNKTTSGYVVTAQDGFRATYNGRYKSILIRAGRGADKVVVGEAVKVPAEMHGGAGADTLMGGSASDLLYGDSGNDIVLGAMGDDTIICAGDGGRDQLIGGLGADTFWLDHNSYERVTDLSLAESRRGAQHRIASYYAPQVATLSAANTVDLGLMDPASSQQYASYWNFAYRPLFAAGGPSAADVVQGGVGDCWFLASLAAVAKADPQEIRQRITDLGDGTYVVQFKSAGKDVYVRVDADLPSYSSSSLAYAGFGAGGSLWAAIMEKAYAMFRKGEASYASLESGWMSEAFSDLGFTSSTSYETTELLARIADWTRSGKAVTFATAEVPAGIPLMEYHAYSVERVIEGSFGTSIVLRNTWGIDGVGSDGNDDGLVTLTAEQAKSAMSGLVVADT